MEDTEWKLRHCRLYDGKRTNEYGRILKKGLSFKEPVDGFKEDKTEAEIKEILAIFYSGEDYWVRLDNGNVSKNEQIISEFERDLGKDFECNDGTPRELQVVLYHYFLDFIDGIYHRFNCQYETDLFKRYYKEYYQPILTPNQKRDEDRRPALIEKCSYFKGEENNPWEYCYSPVLVWRRKIWEIEKEWVNAMVDSYHCTQSSKKLIEDFVLVEFFRAKGIAMSLLNLILTKEKAEAEKEKRCYGPAEAIKTFEKYQKWAPLGRDHRMYFAFYLGEEESPYLSGDSEEYQRMGWSQEMLQLDKSYSMCNFDSKKFQRMYRGMEGIWGWYADPMFPRVQKNILFFNCCNWGRWCPYADVDKLAEEYLNYHYPGDGRPKHSEKFYHDAALNEIKDEPYCCNVRKSGIFEGKRVYRPLYTEEYKKNPVPIGLPLVILVDEDGKTEYIRDSRSFKICDAMTKKGKKK